MDKENILKGEAPIGISSSSLTQPQPPPRPEPEELGNTISLQIIPNNNNNQTSTTTVVQLEIQRAVCVHCSNIFIYNTSQICILKCPTCRQDSIVGEPSLKKSHRKAILNISLGIWLIIMGVFYAVGCYLAAKSNYGEYYIILLAPLIWSAISITRGVRLLRIKQSQPVISISTISSSSADQSNNNNK